MIRWNASFIRGLAESVLKRARVIRSSLTPYSGGSDSPAGQKRKRKKAAVKRARTPRRPNG